MKLSLIEGAVCVGSPTEGSEKAFSVIKELPLFADADKKPLEKVIVSPKNVDNAKNATEVMSVSRSVYESVRNAIRNGSLPVVIGGDHSVAIGSVAGSSADIPSAELAVVYVDGHADINTEESSVSGFIHGMPLASAMGLCSPKLTVGKGCNILGKNVYIIGARSIDENEYPIISENGVHLYTANDVHRRGIEDIMKEILSLISAKYIHLSFDVDVLDGGIFPATGYVMPDGLDEHDVTHILGSVFSTGKVRSFDCVEYNPTTDTDGKSLEIIKRILGQVL